jgi:hypothetical protein
MRKKHIGAATPTDFLCASPRKYRGGGGRQPPEPRGCYITGMERGQLSALLHVYIHRFLPQLVQMRVSSFAEKDLPPTVKERGFPIHSADNTKLGITMCTVSAFSRTFPPKAPRRFWEFIHLTRPYKACR